MLVIALLVELMIAFASFWISEKIWLRFFSTGTETGKEVIIIPLAMAGTTLISRYFLGSAGFFINILVFFFLCKKTMELEIQEAIQLSVIWFLVHFAVAFIWGMVMMSAFH
jgi:hypothetical protein